MHILFYISGHGFGHSTRIIEVANNISPLHKITFVTTVPEWLFKNNLTREYQFRKLTIDAGVQQANFLTVLEKKSLEAYALIEKNRQQIISQELVWLKDNKVDIIVGDIPSLAFAIAAQAGIIGIALANFSWDWIYKPMVENYPEYAYLLGNIKADYKKADLLLRLPMYGDLSVFPYVLDIPLIARKSKKRKEEIRKLLGVKPGRRIILLSFGGHDLAEINFAQLCQQISAFDLFCFNGNIPGDFPNLHSLAHNSEVSHTDLVAGADVVVCKPGYGIVSECIANRAKVLYTARKSFIENDLLVDGLKKWTSCQEIPNEELLAGNWNSYLEQLLSDQLEVNVPSSNGALFAANIIMDWGPLRLC